LFFGPPTTARKSERVGFGEGCGDAAIGDGVTAAARVGPTEEHAVSKTTTNTNRPINIQNAG
jgi:hypothetical protein